MRSCSCSERLEALASFRIGGGVRVNFSQQAADCLRDPRFRAALLERPFPVLPVCAQIRIVKQPCSALTYCNLRTLSGENRAM